MTMSALVFKSFVGRTAVRAVGAIACKTYAFSRVRYTPESRRLYFSSSPNGKPEVRIVEVGPRDGLQSIKKYIPTTTKLDLIKRLAGAGLTDIEATSFVSPKLVPQLADHSDLMREMLRFRAQNQQGHLNLPVLIAPSLKYLQNAHEAGAEDVVVFASATEAFSKANQNCTTEEALSKLEDVARGALSLGLRIRG